MSRRLEHDGNSPEGVLTGEAPVAASGTRRAIESHARRNVWISWIAACTVIFAAAFSGLFTASSGVDFPQYYLGGKMAAEGRWEALYPIPIANAAENAGYPEASTMKPPYASAARDSGIGDTYRYAQPPPLALLLAPLAMLTYGAARIVWLVLMASFLAGTCVLSGLIYRELAGQITAAEPLVVCASALLPRAFLSTRLGNISPFVGFLIGAAIYSMLRGQHLRGGLAIAGGIATKFSPVVVLPVALLRGQIRWVVTTLVAVSFLILGTVAIAGRSPFAEYVSTIAPTQARATFHWSNQTAWGAISNLFYSDRLRTHLILGTRIMEAVVAVLIALLLIIRRTSLKRPGPAIAAVLLLLCWLQVFGPVTWVHNAAYFVPFTGWLWFYCGGNISRLAACILAAVMFLPWASIRLPANMNDAMARFGFVGGMCILAVIAATVIYRDGERPAQVPA